MNNLYVAISNRIMEVTDRSVYNGQADKNDYPYVVIKLLPIENTVSDRDDYTLEISCWDKSESPSHARVVQLADDVRDALIKFRHLDDNQLIMASRPNIGHIPDPDTEIKRYDVTSTLLTYRR